MTINREVGLIKQVTTPGWRNWLGDYPTPKGISLDDSDRGRCPAAPVCEVVNDIVYILYVNNTYQ